MKHLCILFLLFSFLPTAYGAGLSNPDIAANFLGLGQAQLTDYRSSFNNGWRLQEAELQFTSNVDPYFRAVALLSVSQDKGEWKIDPEEVFAETISLPSVIIKFGKFKAAIGRHNLMHTHAYPFIDAPLINQRLLGEEGLNDVGASASVMLPMSWYSEVVAQMINAENPDIFGSPKSGQVAGVLHLKNLWDLSDASTLEWGLTDSEGKNENLKVSSLYGTDLTWKWRPTEGGKYKSLSGSLEYLYGDRKGRIDSNGQDISKLGGFATWLQYQFAERWWVQARYEFVGLQKSEGLDKEDKQSLLLGFFPSEFSGFRVQYDRAHDHGTTGIEHIASLQYNISIGAHPAHAY